MLAKSAREVRAKALLMSDQSKVQVALVHSSSVGGDQFIDIYEGE
jgi:hypothetical protein